MVVELVHAAIGRKMLCKPVNSLIADNELVCAVGMALRAVQAPEEEWKRALETKGAQELQEQFLEFLNILEDAEEDEKVLNLLTMIRNYRGAQHKMDSEYQEILRYGYEHEIQYPAGNFS